MKYLTLIASLFFSLYSIANNQIEPCGTMFNLKERIKKNPSIIENEIKLESFIKNKTKQVRLENRKAGPKEIVTLPVVFHVVYEISNQNISDNRLLSQLQVLNEDFRALNDDVVDIMQIFQDRIGDFEIEFCLAQQDPNGFPHSGITRTQTTNTTFATTNNEVKFDNQGGKDAWPADKYLNIWVCDLQERTGYAQFPGDDPATDGIVLDFFFTGIASSDARTGSHEVGHWVGLRHIWGDGDCSADDFVDDTPLALEATYGCPIGVNSCNNETPDLPDMIQNYMDYAYLDCDEGMFSNGQVERGRTIFEPGGPRFAILESQGCQPSSILDINAQLIEIISPTNSFANCADEINLSYTIKNYGLNEITEMIIKTKVDGSTVNINNWDGNLASNESIDLDLGTFTIDPGTHEMIITIEEVNDAVDQDESDNALTVTFQTGGNEEEIIEGFEAVNFPPDFYQLDNPDFNKTWTLNEDVSHSGAQSIFVRCFNYGNQNTYDDLVLPIKDFSNFNSPVLEFYSAYARYDSEDSDTLEVLVSDNCGESFTSIYKGFGTAIQTAGNSTTEFFPTDDQWKLNTFDLSDFVGNDNVTIKIRCINSFENNMYLDDISIKDQVTSIDDEMLNNKSIFSLYPNPAKDEVNIQLYALDIVYGTIEITNVNGQMLYSKAIYNEKQIQINVDDFTAGIYFVNITSENMNKTEKLMISN